MPSSRTRLVFYSDATEVVFHGIANLPRNRVCRATRRKADQDFEGRLVLCHRHRQHGKQADAKNSGMDA